MRSPEDVITTLLDRWTAEEFTLDEFVAIMRRAGWSKRDVYTYLERECDAAKSRLGQLSDVPHGRVSWT